MRYVRRLIVILTGCATWLIAAATVAYAEVLPEPPLVGDQWWHDVPSTPSTSAAGTPLWQTLAMVTIGVLLVLAVVGLFYSLEHRRSERSQTSHGLHI